MKNQNGSVFFYIIIAIALLASLSYAVSQGNRGNTSTITQSQAQTAAREIIDFGNAIATATQKLSLRGFDVTDLDFGNDLYLDYNNDPLNNDNNNCTDDACRVFALASDGGGGVSPRLFDDYALEDETTPTPSTALPGHVSFRPVSVNSIGTAEPDLVMEIHSLKPEICKQINTLTNSLVSDASPAEDYDRGSENDFSALSDAAGDDNAITGKTQLCLKRADDDQYHTYIHVLLSR